MISPTAPIPTPSERLAAALAATAGAFGVAPPADGDLNEAVLFVAEALSAVVLELDARRPAEAARRSLAGIRGGPKS
jgi:hypothetical protein